jgi:hypothetical protein
MYILRTTGFNRPKVSLAENPNVKEMQDVFPLLQIFGSRKVDFHKTKKTPDEWVAFIEEASDKSRKKYLETKEPFKAGPVSKKSVHYFETEYFPFKEAIRVWEGSFDAYEKKPKPIIHLAF